MEELTEEQISYIEQKELENQIKEAQEAAGESVEISPKKKSSIVLKILALLGFGLTFCGFVVVVLGTCYSFVPTMQTTFKTLEVLFGLGAALIFVGIIVCGIGQNSLKLIARFTYFLATIGFIVAAAMLVLIIVFQKAVPLPAWERMYQESAGIFTNLI